MHRVMYTLLIATLTAACSLETTDPDTLAIRPGTASTAIPEISFAYTPESIQPSYVPQVIIRGNPNLKEIVLTFDDCNSIGAVEQILDYMAQKGIRGSFFPTGTNLDHPEIWNYAMLQGNDILNHTYSHGDFMHSGIMDEQIYGWEQEFQSIYGFAPQKILRIPYSRGITDGNTWIVDEVLQRGYTIAGYSIDTSDYLASRPSQEITDEVIRYIGNGDIILMHPSGRTMEYLVPIVEYGLSQGYTFVTFTEMLSHLGQ
jgi:peptidoglycan-N-acetylglucosamine deacetylase